MTTEVEDKLNEWKPPADLRGRLRRWWYLVLACLLLFTIWPEGTTVGRFYILVGSLTAWLLPLLVWWGRKPVRYALLAVGLIALFYLAGPGRETSAETLRNAYVRELRSLNNAPFRWGGENGFGIDSPALVRIAMVRAQLKRGIYSVNPRLVRQALVIWWNDYTEVELGAGLPGLLERLASADSINEMPDDVVLPGDLAVMAGAAQVVAYLGGGEWILADHDAGRVTIRRVPVQDRLWFQQSVYLLRWQRLSPETDRP